MIELTPREHDVVTRVAKGMTIKQIAGELDISGQRVRIIIAAIAYKAQLDPSRDDRVQLAVWWATLGIAERYSA